MLYLLQKKKLIVVAILALGLTIAACNDEAPPTVAATEPDVDDISANATLTVSDEHPDGQFAGEGSNKLIDGDITTKFLTFDYTADFWMQQDFEEIVTINAYTVTSGNDAPERDPLNWTLAGSNDGGTTWEAIDTITEATFSDRNKVNIYQLESEESYSSYRFFITEIAGETTLLQISEWRLLYYNEIINIGI